MTDTTSEPENEDAPEPPVDSPSLEENSGEEQGLPLSSWEIIAGVVLLFAAIVIIVVLAGGEEGDEGDDTATSLSTPGVTALVGGPANSSGMGAPPSSLSEAVPPAPLATTELVADSFDRADADSLGEAETGQTWISEMGTWGIKGNAVHVVEPREEGFRHVALLDTETVYMNQGSVAVDFKNAVSGSGIVFRYKNPFNYYALVAQPGGVNWKIEQIVAGKSTNLGLVSAPSTGSVSMTVQLRGLFFDVYAGDRAVASVKGEVLPLAGGVGLYATDAAIEQGAWDAITVGEGAVQLDAVPAGPSDAGADTTPAAAEP